MAYRSFSTGTWQDPWFETLSPKAKLLFIYLWTNDVCNQAGLYQISMRRAEFETGLKPSEIIKELFPKVEWYPDCEVVWVKNFFKKQCANVKFAYAAIRSLYCIPQPIVEKFTQWNLDLIEKYGIDTVSIPHKTEFCTLSVSGTGTDTDTGTPASGRGMIREKGFDDFWKAYPRKIGKQEAKKSWVRQNGNRPELEIIIAKIEELKKSYQWTNENGKFIPHPSTWLNRGGWDDEPEIKLSSQKNVKYNNPEEDAKKWTI